MVFQGSMYHNSVLFLKYFDDNIPEASQDKIKRGRLLKQAFPQRRKRKRGKNLENPSQEYHYHGVTTVTMLTDISEEAMLLFDGNADVSPVRNEEEIQRIVAGLDVHITKVDNEENLVRIALEKANEDKARLLKITSLPKRQEKEEVAQCKFAREILTWSTDPRVERSFFLERGKRCFQVTETEPFQIFTTNVDGNTMWQILNNQTLQSWMSMQV